MACALRVASVAMLVCVATALCPALASAQPPQVYVFPMPGGRVASSATQITLRGVPAAQIGSVTVTGSQSGVHAGTIEADSDGNGGSFLPAKPFTPGETVTVSTSLNVYGAHNGAFQFTVAQPAGGIGPLHWPAAPRAASDVWLYHSRPDLEPASVTITKRSSKTAAGDIFVAPQFGPVQDGPEILDPNGSLVWFDPLTGNQSAGDFEVQSYHGSPVLTWWQGYVSAGIGVGQDLIYNSAYQPVAAIHAGNGLTADLHDFRLTPQGTALIVASYPVYWDASAVRGASKREDVLDSVVQEIDIPTGLVLFQWDSLDHISVSDTYEALPPSKGRYPFDYFHVNSVQLDFDGNLLISGRNTWAAYKLDHHTGNVLWRLGGKHSSFKLAPGTYWAFQHDVRARAAGDMFVTLLDNSAGPPTVHNQSRGVKLFLDLKHMTARQVASHVHTPSLSAVNEGNFQQLSNRDDFIGWGNVGYFTEYDPRGNLLLDGHFVGANSDYCAYRFQWSGTPTTPPAVAASQKGRKMSIYASWNGATGVHFWRIFGGSGPSSLRPLATVTKNGFETVGTVGAQAYAAVQALDSSRRVLGTSPAVRVG
ncbi:MAG: aryl-sulfate sulfotransferase [Actinobacteria bacterium]|nr:aryl-sulfate sulfotransferase [Actinomycetota bacterium]